MVQIYVHFTFFWFYLFPFRYVLALFHFDTVVWYGEVNFCWQNSVEQKIFVVTVYKIVEVNFILCPVVTAHWMVSAAPNVRLDNLLLWRLYTRISFYLLMFTFTLKSAALAYYYSFELARAEVFMRFHLHLVKNNGPAGVAGGYLRISTSKNSLITCKQQNF